MIICNKTELFKTTYKLIPNNLQFCDILRTLIKRMKLSPKYKHEPEEWFEAKIRSEKNEN